jgi:hypothetical protein
MATSRPFAYNTGSSIPGTEQVGSLAIGFPTSGFDSTGLEWWNGPDEDSGYVIACSVPGDSQPTPVSGVSASVGFFRTSDFNESSFISLAENISRSNGTPQTFVSGSAASSWLTTNGFWNSYSAIVTNNLLVYLDSGDPASYPGTGNTWYDLQGASNDATLINSPTFSASSGGILQFDDASSQYATIPDLGDLSQWTVEAWFNLSTALTNKVTAVVCNQFNLVNKLNFSIGTNNAPINRNIAVGFYDGAWRTTAGFAPQVGVWYQVVGTYDGSVVRQYVNGDATGGTLNYAGTPQSGGEVRIMRRWDETLTSPNFVDGDLAIVRIYSAALSAAEVEQNFSSDKSRFGL